MMAENVTSSTSSNLVPTSSGTRFGESSNNLVPYSPVGDGWTRFAADAEPTRKQPVEILEKWTRFGCVKCGTETGPDALLCQACYEARRPPVCPTCGGRLAGGKCGWC